MVKITMRSFCALTLACGVLGACSSDEHQDLKSWMLAESQTMQGKIQPLPKLVEFPAVEFEVLGLVSPFEASRLDPERKGGKSSPRNDPRRREPLESYPLESLKMVGMMLMSGKPVALIRADKTVHQINAGNYLGQNFGVVTKITENDLTLKELIEDANGDWIERFSTMELQEQETKK